NILNDIMDNYGQNNDECAKAFANALNYQDKVTGNTPLHCTILSILKACFSSLHKEINKNQITILKKLYSTSLVKKDIFNHKLESRAIDLIHDTLNSQCSNDKVVEFQTVLRNMLGIQHQPSGLPAALAGADGVVLEVAPNSNTNADQYPLNHALSFFASAPIKKLQFPDTFSRVKALFTNKEEAEKQTTFKLPSPETATPDLKLKIPPKNPFGLPLPGTDETSHRSAKRQRCDSDRTRTNTPI
ncbi:MAG: hypothetical protein AAF195_02765, partial [Pseudomonadota bacterium]